MDSPFVCIMISVLLTFLILGFVGLAGDYMKYKRTDALQAKPVTTEVPEFIAKCSKMSFSRNSCTEYTIYRITRN